VVIHLGIPSVSAPAALAGGYRRIRQGQALHLHTISTSAVTLRAWARVVYDDGSEQLLTVREIARAATRTAEDLVSTDVVVKDGWVVNAEVEMLTPSIKRGQTYVRLTVEPFGAALLSDYCFSDFGHVSLGTFIQPGPGGGSGHLEIATIKAEGAPASTTTHTMALSNTIRKIYYWHWYYGCSGDVASRLMDVEYRSNLGALPTGFTNLGATTIWATQLGLTANQEGSLWARGAGSGINDNTAESLDDQSSKPQPLPFLIQGDDPGTITFFVTLGEVLDVDVIYLLRETWVML